MAKSIQTLVFLLFSISAHAVDYDKTQQQADRYMREIREREDRNREKFDDLERREKERALEYEVQQLRQQYEFDRLIDESR
jgi:hypothetical protein